MIQNNIVSSSKQGKSRWNPYKKWHFASQTEHPRWNIHVKWLSSHHCLIAPLIHVEVAFYFIDRKFILVNKLMNCSIDRPKQPSNDKIMELAVASVHHYSVKIKIHKSDVWNLAEVLICLPTQVDDDSHCCCCRDKTTPAVAATQSNKRNLAVVTYKKNAYCEPYYCPSIIILLSNSYI